MRLKYTFEMMELDDQLIAIPISDNTEEFKAVIKLNETAAFLFDLLKNEMTEMDIVNAVCREYNVSYERASIDVHRIIDEFQKRGLLV